MLQKRLVLEKKVLLFPLVPHRSQIARDGSGGQQIHGNRHTYVDNGSFSSSSNI